MADSSAPLVDLLVIGGGINGTGIARDAAGRGLSVMLVEKGDLAGATSSASTKLIHGGLRYLEHYEFRLVREALSEREVVLRLAPHLVYPLEFVLPHAPHLRPKWMIRIGLFLYDHLGGRRSLPGSKGIKLKGDLRGASLKPEFTDAFTYSDCWVDDARLVVCNAMDARARGVEILTRTALLSAARSGDHWVARIGGTHDEREVRARAIVNAAGPWVRDVVTGALRINASNGVRLVRGSHIVVPRMFEGEHAYIFQNADKRVIFAIPYQNDRTLIGTTDVPVEGDPARAAVITNDEISYLCAAASEYFVKPVTPADVVWTYSGVRPLFDDGHSDPSEVTRDYVLDLDAPQGQAPVLSVYGGKITTFRELGVHALAKLKPFFPNMGGDWTAESVLPGGNLPAGGRSGLVEQLVSRHASLDRAFLSGLAARHGTRAEKILAGIASMTDLGEHFGGGLYAREVDWLVREEWAVEADDILWRRTKCGLKASAAQRERLAQYLKSTIPESIA